MKNGSWNTAFFGHVSSWSQNARLNGTLRWTCPAVSTYYIKSWPSARHYVTQRWIREMMTSTQCRGQRHGYKPPSSATRNSFSLDLFLPHNVSRSDPLFSSCYGSPISPLLPCTLFMAPFYVGCIMLCLQCISVTLQILANLNRCAFIVANWQVLLGKTNLIPINEMILLLSLCLLCGHSESCVACTVLAKCLGQMKDIRLNLCLLRAQWTASLNNLSFASNRGLVTSCVISAEIVIYSPIYQPNIVLCCLLRSQPHSQTHR